MQNKMYDIDTYREPAKGERKREAEMKNLRMKAARAAKDMSQGDLAKAVEVTRQTIGMIEAGDYNPTLNLCIRICRALDKTLDELFWEGE